MTVSSSLTCREPTLTDALKLRIHTSCRNPSPWTRWPVRYLAWVNYIAVRTRIVIEALSCRK